MRTLWSAVLLWAACVTPALAQNPQPPAELDVLASLAGTWSCEGTFSVDEGGPEQPMRSTITVARDLDDFWWSGRAVREKTRDDPRPLSRLFFWSFDQVLKQFVGGWLDSRGAWLTCTSSGWKDDVLTFLGHVTAAGTRRTARETFSRPTDGAFDHTFQMLNVNPNAWVRVSTEHCRKTEAAKP